MYTTRDILRMSEKAVLYRGTRSRDGKPVVIKVLAAQHRPQQRERLKNDYELGRMLNLPTVVTPVALETYQGMPALVLEDFGGVSLDDQLGAPMEPARFLRLAVRIAGAVADIHQRNVVHKDLKPENILLHPDTGEVKIADFEIASTLPCQRQAAGVRLIEGSLPYMSPEQTGWTNRALDQRSDLYSLGVTFYQLLTGRLPFQATDPLEWVHCHVARSPVPPVEAVPSVPPMLSLVVMKLLAKEAGERYQSARGLRHDLDRCLEQWTAHGRIEPFALGERDVADRFQIPRRLYGREQEVAVLLSAFGRVAGRGSPELALVSGYSGIGKSTLVHELQAPVVRAHGFFAAGKFDQWKRDIPYSTIVQAFTEVVLEILAGSQERIATWRAHIQDALGVNGQLIVEVIPPVELVIGPQPPVPVLPPTESQNRFRIAFRRFIGVFASQQHPLALFLDDLQWADLASLALIQDLLTHPETRHVLVVGAYRDNEVPAAHALMASVSEIRKAGVPVSEVLLGPLSSPHLAAFFGDVLHRSASDVTPLAQLVEEKTGGNPFFAIQFLTTLQEERLIELDGASAWRWDIERIRAKGFTDNVVDLMAGKLKRLSPDAQTAMKELACLGTGAEVSTLALVLGKTDEQVHGDLAEAVRAGMLLRLGEAYKFIHDRVAEAAYSLVPASSRAAAHLRIGRLLRSKLAADAADEWIFEVTNQLNRGVELIHDPAERQTLMRLDFLAGKKAKASIAYASARALFLQATALLPAHTWDACYEETFPLYLELAECEYLTGDFRRADELFALTLDRARTDPERARVSSLRVRMYQVAGRYDDALASALDALARFSVEIPEGDAEIAAAVAIEQRQIDVNLSGRRIADLVDAPPMTDARVQAVMGLLVDALPPTYIARPALFPLLVCKALNLSLRHGSSAESCFIYSCYGMLLVSVFGEIPAAFEYSKAALRLNEKLGDAKLKGTLLFMHACFIIVWRRHLGASLPILDQALRASLDVGDLVYAGYTALVAVATHIERGDALDDVLKVSQRYKAFAQQSRNQVLYQCLRQYDQLAACLKGQTRGLTSFDDGDHDEAACLTAMTEAGFQPGIFYHHLLKHIACFVFEQFDEALAASERTRGVLSAVMSARFEATHYFYEALTLAAVYPRAPGQAGVPPAEFGRTLEPHLRKLKLWAEHCPENYLACYALVSAEVARVEGREVEAMRLYEQAIAAAEGNGFIQRQALANELASRFYRGRGFERIAETYLREAQACYARWGAEAKVRQIDRTHPRLRQKVAGPEAHTTFSVEAEQIDVLSVVKATQTISSEIVLDQLLRTLLEVVLEQGGAQKVYLILVRRGELHIEAEATLGAGGVETQLLQSLPVASSPRLPTSLVNYVERTREPLIIDNAADEVRYAADAYVAQVRPRSILCLPIIRRGDLVAILYLENNLTTQAFTAERLVALELLGAQAAISLENALLLANEQKARAAAEQARETAEAAERRLTFLAHELRSPLASVVLRLGSLIMSAEQAESVPSATLMPGLSGLKRLIDRLTVLIDSLLDLSRMQRGQLLLAREPIDLVAVTQDVIARLMEQGQVATSPVNLEATTPVIGRWDRLRLEQVVTNLLTNALKYGAGKPVRVGVKESGHKVVLSVTDQGIGIAAADQQRIFEPFERATALASGHSLGLGLYLVRQIVRAHDGRIRVDSQPGAGSTFTVELPL